MKFNNLLFDFDGTLVDTAGMALSIYNSICGKYGLKIISPEEFQRLRSLTVAEFISYLKIGKFKIPILLFEMKLRLNLRMKTIPLSKQGLRRVISGIRKNNPGAHVGIVTSNWKRNVKRFLKLNDLPFFDFIYSSAAYSRKEREIERAMKDHALDRENTIYIGDEIRDIAAARKCGIKIIAVSWGYNTAEILRTNNADFIIHEPEELTGIVE